MIVGLPLLGEMLWVMGIRVSIELFGMAAHKKWMEDSEIALIRRIAPEVHFASWEEGGGHLALGSVANGGVFISFAMLAIGIAGACFYELWSLLPNSRWIFYTDSTMFSLLFVIICLGAREALSMYSRTLQSLQTSVTQPRSASSD